MQKTTITTEDRDGNVRSFNLSEGASKQVMDILARVAVPNDAPDAGSPLTPAEAETYEENIEEDMKADEGYVPTSEDIEAAAARKLAAYDELQKKVNEVEDRIEKVEEVSEQVAENPALFDKSWDLPNFTSQEKTEVNADGSVRTSVASSNGTVKSTVHMIMKDNRPFQRHMTTQTRIITDVIVVDIPIQLPSASDMAAPEDDSNDNA